MALPLSPVEICNLAIDYIGAERITTFEDSTREARICKSHYELTVRNVLESYPWRFSIKQVELAQVSAKEPLFGFKFIFKLPADYLGLNKRDRSGFEYSILGDELHINVDKVIVNYKARVSEGLFPSYFIDPLVYQLAMKFSVSMLDRTDRLTEFKELRNDSLRMGKSADSQSQGTHRIPDDKFIFTLIRQ